MQVTPRVHSTFAPHKLFSYTLDFPFQNYFLKIFLISQNFLTCLHITLLFFLLEFITVVLEYHNFFPYWLSHLKPGFSVCRITQWGGGRGSSICHGYHCNLRAISLIDLWLSKHMVLQQYSLKGLNYKHMGHLHPSPSFTLHSKPTPKSFFPIKYLAYPLLTIFSLGCPSHCH